MLKKLLCVVLSLFTVIWFLPVCSKASQVLVSAESAVVLNAYTGEILYSKNPYEKRGMASTTKIMTSLVALEYGNLTDTVKAKLSDVTVEGTSIGLKDGDEVLADDYSNLNQNSLVEMKHCKLEAAFNEVEGIERFQFLRNGYFCVDSKDSTKEHPVYNRIVSLKSSYRPK